MRRGLAVRAMVVTAVGLLALMGSGGAAAQSSAEDFVFDGVEAVYLLERDDEGRALMRVTETLTAVFPDRDQNKGIVRGLPRKHDGHPLGTEVESVTRNGEPEPIYSESSEGDELLVATGTDDFLRGEQVFSIEYRMRDVIDDADGAQEWYWDVLPAGSAQPYGPVTVTLELSPEVAGLFDGRARCLEGAEGSTRECEASIEDDEVRFTSTRPLGEGEGMTVVAGFAAGAFEPYTEGALGVIASALSGAAALLAAGAMALAIRIRATVGRSAPRGREITASYSVPQGLSILRMAAIHGHTMDARAVPAQIVDLAIRGKIRLVEVESGGSHKYRAELMDPTGLDGDEQELVDALFPTGNTVHELSEPSSSTTSAIAALRRRIKEEIITDGYRRRVPVPRGVVAGGAVAVAGAVAAFIALAMLGPDWRIAVAIGALVVAIPAIVLAFDIRPLTEKGRAVADQLDATAKYFDAAGTTRTSSHGTGDLPGSESPVIEFHERALPHAMLCGAGKDWVERLSEKYEAEGAAPYWFIGPRPFSPVVFIAMQGGIGSTGAQVAGGSAGGFSGGSVGGGGGGGSVGGR
ncbi:DUF2207 domain-containing protein [Hoyosella sp. G463]|uniref:DUF2207 domain-containing protein n=1 Tax=Lolliginicoccus lacisalsi TaxID=2742202 RepID=A0A927JDP7_9ACTN|nr:DUF2207 domain-containing protein [Lolliginicoccus lacisalsi]MBD8506925.1 DUF2207 domain-containing protein [Lolliginicoccus lacisalsi]